MTRRRIKLALWLAILIALLLGVGFWVALGFTVISFGVWEYRHSPGMTYEELERENQISYRAARRRDYYNHR
jgi:hypothetical protein